MTWGLGGGAHSHIRLIIFKEILLINSFVFLDKERLGASPKEKMQYDLEDSI